MDISKMNVDKLGERELGEFLRRERVFNDEQAALHLYTYVARGIVEAVGSGVGTRTGKCYAQLPDGTKVANCSGILEIVGTSDAATDPYWKDYFTFSVTSGGGAIIAPTTLTGRNCVEVITASNGDLLFTLTATTPANAATTGVKVRFRPFRGIPMLDSMGMLDMTDFA